MRELKRIRKQKGVTQRQLAEASGVDPATISLVETGKRQPKIETLESLARALGVEVGEFFPPGQPDLFTAAEPRAGYTDPRAEVLPLELAELYEADRAVRRRALEAASAEAVAAYLADLSRAIDNASRGPDDLDTADTRRQLVEHVQQLSRMQTEAEVFGRAIHAGVA